jgi:hypothetical protein
MCVVSTWVADGLKVQDSSRNLTSPLLAPAPWVACSWVVANPVNYWEALWVCDGNNVYLTQDFGATFAVITGNLQVRTCFDLCEISVSVVVNHESLRVPSLFVLFVYSHGVWPDGDAIRRPGHGGHVSYYSTAQRSCVLDWHVARNLRVL